MQSDNRYRLGSFRLDPETLSLYKDEQDTKLRRRACEVLKCLFEAPNGITLQRLMDHVWDCNVVGTTIRRTVDDLRDALGPEYSVCIETRTSGRGYVLNRSAAPVARVRKKVVVPAETQPNGCDPLSGNNYLNVIALERSKMHVGRAIRSSITKYTDVLKNGHDTTAYIQLARAYLNLSHTGFCLDFPQRTIPFAREILARALAYDPCMASAYAIRGLTYLVYDYDWEKASDDFHRALDLDRDDAYAHNYLGRLEIAHREFDSGLSHITRAIELDCTTPMTAFVLPWMLIFADRHEEAMATAQKAVDLYDPFPVGNIINGYALDAAGFTKAAIVEYKKALGLDLFPDALARLGRAHARLGKISIARSYLDRLQKEEAEEGITYLSGFYEALVHVGLGDSEAAISCLENALLQKCDWLVFLNVEPCWEPLRKSGRFNALCTKVGLKPLE